MEGMKIVCRLCLNFTTYDECQTLDTVSKDMLKFILPKIDLDISYDPKICQTCYKTVLKCYRFKSNCNKEEIKTEVKKHSDPESTEMISVHVEEVEKKCDFCSSNIDEESLEEFSARKTYYDEVLRKCLPEWNLSSNSVPCKRCSDSLSSHFTFIGNCDDTEDKLKHYRLTQGTNSEGKLNLYEAVRHILGKETKDSGSMTDMDEDMSHGYLHRAVNNDDVPFPEFRIKTENIEMEEVNIKMEVFDEEENISTSESEVSKTQGTKSAKQPRKSMKSSTNSTEKEKLFLNPVAVPLVSKRPVKKKQLKVEAPSTAKKAKTTDTQTPAKPQIIKRSIGVQVSPNDLIQTCSIGIQVDIMPPPSSDSVDTDEGSITSTTGKSKKFKPRILRREKKVKN